MDKALLFALTLVASWALPSALLAEEPDAAAHPAGAGGSQEEATLFPIPDYGGDLSERPALSGDWAGLRTTLAEHGIQLELDATQFYQGILDGGFDEREKYSGSADYRLKLDTGKAGLWPGGFVEAHGETYWGRDVNFQTGALLPTNFDAALKQPAGNGTYLSHLVVTQFLSESFALIGGKIDTSAGDANEYAHGVGDQNFMNAGFLLNPVTYFTSPYSTLGAGIIYLFGEEKQHIFNLMVYDGDGRIDTTGFDTVFDDNTTYAIAGRVRTNFFDKPGHQWLGFLYGKGRYDAQATDPRLPLPDLPLLPGSPPEPEIEHDTWALFYNFDQQLVATNPDDPEQGWGVFGRFGLADRDTSVIRSFTSIGLGGTGVIPSRPQDRFGVGYYYMYFNSTRFESILQEDDEHAFEAFYNVVLTPWVTLSANLQILDGGLLDADTAVIGGLRLRIGL